MTNRFGNKAYCFEEVDVLRFPVVNAFYKHVRQRVRLKSSDRVFIVKNEQKIIAAVRLQDDKPYYFLRNMQVVAGMQRQGVGHYLLQNVMPILDTKACYCYPFTHLQGFYEQAGFLTVSSRCVPEGIIQKYHRYVAQGRDIIIMVTPQLTASG